MTEFLPLIGSVIAVIRSIGNDEQSPSPSSPNHNHSDVTTGLLCSIDPLGNHVMLLRIEALQDGTRNIPDVNDRASEETDRALELRTRDRQRKLVSKIDAALRRIDEDEFGYCSVTGEPISLKRLDARPIATMSLEAQERHERREKVHRDD